MAQRLTTSFINTVTPGAYPNVTVRSSPVGIGATGIISIIGEAEGGAHFSDEALKDNFFTPDQFSQVREKYISGPIVDAFGALTSPSNDANIQGSVNRIYVLKTNPGAKASSLVDTNYGTLSAQNWGKDGNKIKFQVTASVLEQAPSITSAAIAALSNAGATAEVTSITLPAVASITTGQYFLIDSPTVAYYVWFNKDGGGGDPAPAGKTAIMVAVTTGDTASQVATATQLAIDALAAFVASVLVDVVTVTNFANGEAPDAVNFNVGGVFAISTTTQGGLYNAAALNAASFSFRMNGAAAVTITLGSIEADHDTVAELIVELNALLPAGIEASAGVSANTIVLAMDADSNNYRKGWAKSLQLIDSSPGDLALLGLTAGLYSSAAESAIEMSIVRPDIGLNETLEAKGQIALEVGYEGTTASLSIVDELLTTTVVGGAGANLSIDISQYQTVSDLAAFIASQDGYSASATAAGTQNRTSDLDKVLGIGICSTAASLTPGKIKKSLKNFKDAMLQSSAVEFVSSDVDGLPSPMASAVFLSGGAKGATAAVEIIDALVKLEGIATNFVVPLFSRDSADDIADALTESGSTYTIDALHAAVKNHCLKMSTPKLKRNRLAILSFMGDYSDVEVRSQTLASFRCSMAFQEVDQVNSVGESTTFQPWYGAVLAAGMQAAGFYKGITNKLTNAVSYRDPDGFDSGSPGDIEQALLAGLLILQSDTAGIKWVSDQTTYGYDTNFVYNSLQASYDADLVALDMAESFQRAFVGQSLADVDAATALAFLATKMDGYRKVKLLSASDDAPLGYKNAKITINGPVMEVAVEIKLSTTIYFIPISIEISQVQQSAS